MRIAEAQGQSSDPEAHLTLLMQAGILLGAAGAIRQASQSPMTPDEQGEYGEQLAKFKSLPEAKIFEAACLQGNGMSMEAAIDYSLALEVHQHTA